MINSINGVNQSKLKPFDIVSARNEVADYWIAENNHSGLNVSNALDSILPDAIILNPEEARKTNNLKIIGISIASVTVLAAAGIFFVLRGGPKGVAKGFQVLRNFLERKVQKSKLTGATASGYEYLLGKADYLLGKAQAINNFTTIKDYAFKRLMYGKNSVGKYTKKIHKGITNMFERLGLKTVSNSYAKAISKFSAMSDTNKQILSELGKSGDLSTPVTINDFTFPKSTWLKMADDMSKNIDNLLEESFSGSVRKSRYLKIKRSTKELEQSFDDKGPLWFLSKDTLNTFVADTTMLPKKLKIQDAIKVAKYKISHSTRDLYRDADDIIMQISSKLGFDDSKTFESLNAVRENFKIFVKTGEVDAKKMSEDLDNLKNNVNSLSFNKTETLEMINELESLYMNYKKGLVDNILDIYKVLLPKEKYEKVEKEFQSAVKSLNKSIKLETNDFINKSRDLTMGSAPTDVLTVLGGFGTLAYYLGKSDSAQERTAITLKYGIPALVGIGVSLYGNARLFAGSKSLLFATISSFAANRIGTIANNIYENYLKKKGKYVESKN